MHQFFASSRPGVVWHVLGVCMCKVCTCVVCVVWHVLGVCMCKDYGVCMCSMVYVRCKVCTCVVCVVWYALGVCLCKVCRLGVSVYM